MPKKSKSANGKKRRASTGISINLPKSQDNPVVYVKIYSLLRSIRMRSPKADQPVLQSKENLHLLLQE